MEQSLRNDDFGFKDTNLKVLKKTTENVMLTKKCNQCRYASSNSGHLALNQMLSTTLRYEVLWGLVPKTLWWYTLYTCSSHIYGPAQNCQDFGLVSAFCDQVLVKLVFEFYTGKRNLKVPLDLVWEKYVWKFYNVGSAGSQQMLQFMRIKYRWWWI